METELESAWPPLAYAEWRDTCATLHRWTQIVGKTRMVLSPPVNHWWHVTLQVTPRGLSTSSIPYGADLFEVSFDFIDHELRVVHGNGQSHAFPLRPWSVADFYSEYMAALRSVGVDVRVWTKPVEVEDRTRFDEDVAHRSYDAEAVQRFFRVLTQVHRVFGEFRSRFQGKVSPVHFFWGAFDLAVTRFSGRPAPEHPGAPHVARFVAQEAYCQEVSSAGFWPGGGGYDDAAFYSYAYPEPKEFKRYRVAPDSAFYHDDLREFVLPYDAVRTDSHPEKTLLGFLQTTYDAAADLGRWDRGALECFDPSTEKPCRRGLQPLQL